MTSTSSRCTCNVLQGLDQVKLLHQARVCAMTENVSMSPGTWIGWEPKLVQGMATVRRFANARSTATGSPSNRLVKSSSRLCSTTPPPDRDALTSDPVLPALLTKRLSSLATKGVSNLSICA